MAYDVVASYRELKPHPTAYTEISRSRYRWRWLAWLMEGGEFMVVRTVPLVGPCILKQQIMKVEIDA